ncbi:hypothetical protein [Fimbriiglobus ruber]|uniref:Uncharacterized protein n=1 Tax=Fimbriiglobus ruber TaxID=1908690 RepID=A0A225E775_9BACT|nr:hypothetical protein [Fimbriiglobus ruber]OWK46648.1 hypothetical protein FRUB_00347 [Fimbriiglobus ruber]
MGEQRGREWERTLDEVERAIGVCLASLDGYEQKFAEVLATTPTPVGEPSLPAPILAAGSDDGFATRLASAGQYSEDVEKVLAEQETVWGEWRNALLAWQQTLDIQTAVQLGR